MCGLSGRAVRFFVFVFIFCDRMTAKGGMDMESYLPYFTAACSLGALIACAVFIFMQKRGRIATEDLIMLYAYVRGLPRTGRGRCRFE